MSIVAFEVVIVEVGRGLNVVGRSAFSSAPARRERPDV